MIIDDEFYDPFESKRQKRQKVLDNVGINYWAAAAAVAIAAYASYKQGKKDEALIEDSIADQEDRDALFREDFKPFLKTGLKANTLLDQILFQGDISSLRDDPILQEQLAETTQRSNRAQAAVGRLGSGANAVDIFRRSGNVYNAKINQLMTLSGRGQQGTLAQGQLGAQTTGNIVNSMQGLIDANQAQGRNQQNLISNAYFAYLQSQKD